MYSNSEAVLSWSKVSIGSAPAGNASDMRQSVGLWRFCPKHGIEPAEVIRKQRPSVTAAGPFQAIADAKCTCPETGYAPPPHDPMCMPRHFMQAL